MDVYELRLEVIKAQVLEHIKRCREMLAEFRAGKCLPRQVEVALIPLRAKNQRYVSEIHICLKNMVVQDPDFIITHTNVQMVADTLIAEIEDARKVVKCTEQMENVTSKLPKLELIKFKGDVLKWHEFCDRFSSSVHNKNIRDVDKLAYLNNCLVGKAKEAVVGLETTDKNYQIALKVLQERFGKQAVVIDAHYSELFKLNLRDETVTEARRVINEIERHLRVLNSLGENTEGAYLRNVIIEKFPQDIVKELRMRMISEDEPVPMIRKHLEHIVTARESSDQKTTPTFSTEVLHIQEKANYARKQVSEHRFNKPFT